jgi:hypothetical protein
LTPENFIFCTVSIKHFRKGNFGCLEAILFPVWRSHRMNFLLQEIFVTVSIKHFKGKRKFQLEAILFPVSREFIKETFYSRKFHIFLTVPRKHFEEKKKFQLDLFSCLEGIYRGDFLLQEISYF